MKIFSSYNYPDQFDLASSVQKSQTKIPICQGFKDKGSTEINFKFYHMFLKGRFNLFYGLTIKKEAPK